MLTSDLLVSRIYKGRIEPVYASLNEETLDIASSVIDIFKRHICKTYGELAQELEGFEDINYRLVRGMSQILEKRCVVEEDSAIDPIAARMVVFEEAGGLIISGEERKEVLDRAAAKLSIEPDGLEKALWADLEENLVINDFRTIAPKALIEQYNLSLAQTLLFKATGMEIQIEDGYQPVFWAIKKLGLMYSIVDGRIYLDGPISLFKMTERYGTAFAKLLPSVMVSTKWNLKASILRKTPQGKKIYEFYLDHTRRETFGMGRVSEIGGDNRNEEEEKDAGNEERDSGTGRREDRKGLEVKNKVGFDSAVEKEFYQLDFHGWKVRREPTVLKSGKYAFIPDFSLERKGTRIYVEIIGFWTPEYLRNKMQKINGLDEKEPFLLLVNKSLGCSGSEFKTDNVIFFDKKIPHLAIIKILRMYEERQMKDDIEKLKHMEISLDSDMGIVSLEELARKFSVSLGSLEEVIKEKSKEGYLLLGDQLVSKEIHEAVQKEMAGVKKHQEAIKIFERYGIKAHAQALESLGYKVRWTGLDPEKVEILRA
jgi:predicted nuclease of restriction endonuclease-like RecB superfamily